ncbi:hypothetical protein LXL04_024225 [Taraxacum kok-saghyz]
MVHIDLNRNTQIVERKGSRLTSQDASPISDVLIPSTNSENTRFGEINLEARRHVETPENASKVLDVGQGPFTNEKSIIRVEKMGQTLSATFNPSMAMMKRKGDKGSPCLTPFEILNSSVGDPLTTTEAHEEDKHPRIQKRHLFPKPIARAIDVAEYHRATSTPAVAAPSSSQLRIDNLPPFLLPCQPPRVFVNMLRTSWLQLKDMKASKMTKEKGKWAGIGLVAAIWKEDMDVRLGGVEVLKPRQTPSPNLMNDSPTTPSSLAVAFAVAKGVRFAENSARSLNTMLTTFNAYGTSL